ncbi:MAG TPA: lipoprotein insertase outer membrane protein LolB [Pseudomonadales bacterium]|nr:lipoprotein insertase outer membrane protein LolB [Pseudomonadales bacterium]
MSRPSRSLLALLVVLALGGCVAPAPAPDDRSAVAVRRFTLDGKVSWRHPEGSGRAAVEWLQDDDHSRLLVTGPFGTGAALLDSGPEASTLRIGDRVSSAASAEQLLGAELAMPLPVAEARWWVLGLTAPGAVRVLERDGDGRLLRFEQAGWRVAIDRWTAVDGIALPGRLVMEQDALRVLFVATRWQPGVAAWPADA